MGAPDLIFELRRKGYSIVADGGYLDISPADLPPELVNQLKQSKPEILTELQRETQTEARRQKVLAMLEAHPETQRAILADIETDADNVILTIVIRNVATAEMLIPKAKYDPWRLLELVERHGQTTH